MQLPICTALRVCSLQRVFSRLYIHYILNLLTQTKLNPDLIITKQRFQEYNSKAQVQKQSKKTTKLRILLDTYKGSIVYNQQMSVRIPYVNTGERSKPDSSFIDLLQNRVCPHFSFCSITTLLLTACLVIFVASRLMYAPGGYSTFLQNPTEMYKWTLQVEKVKGDKKYFYQVATSMFLHQSYRHIIMNVIFGIFIMYELEYCWRWSILLALLGGFAANCMALVTMEGRLLGFSGVLCACIGIQIASLLLHCNYLRQVYQGQFYIVLMMTVFTLLMVIGLTQAGLVHFFGIIFGLVFGLGLYPRMPEASINENIDKIFKVVAVGFLGLAVLLALIS